MTVIIEHSGREVPEVDDRDLTGTVFWAWIHDEDVRAAYMASVIAAFTSASSGPLVGSFFDVPSGPTLSIARNMCAEVFLSNRQDWLWFVDTDMVFSPEVLPSLLELAHPVKRPIMSAAIPIAGRRQDEFGALPEVFWAAYSASDSGELSPIPIKMPLGPCLKVDAVGTGCLLIHRSVFEAIGPGPFCEESNARGVVHGEDLSFCRRAARAGIPVHVAGNVRVGHAKVVTL